jgi:hypothetical protein
MIIIREMETKNNPSNKKKRKTEQKADQSSYNSCWKKCRLTHGADSHPYKNHLDFVDVISIATFSFPAAIFMLN